MDVATFSERVLGRRLWPHQIELAESDAFISSTAAARRTGKTVAGETVAMHTAFSNRACKVLVLSATQDAARRLTESIGAQLGSNRLTRGAVVDDFATRIRLTNGSEIISLPASQRQVRGYGEGVLLVILDEAGFMPAELWTAAHYTALDERPRSRVLMLGTPWGGPDHFFRQAFEAGQRGDQDHASFHWTYDVNPKLDRAYLERQRLRVSPPEYAAEVLGEWSDAVGALFPRELLDRQTADLELPPLDALQPPARGIVGVDWGVSFDRSAAATIFRLPGLGTLNPDAEPLARFVVLPVVWPAKTPLHQTVDEVVRAQRALAFISTETTGVGAGPSQELARRLKKADTTHRLNFCATTSAKKTAGYGTVLSLLERGQLVLPRHPDLLRQLAGLRFEQGERGFMRIEADAPAVHDDVADALMLATLPYKSKRGRVQCALARMASPEGAVPDCELPERYEAPTVSTGGGLSLWRRPPLQSAAGTGLTLPARLVQTEPPTVGAFTIQRRSL